jgi:hypothetical protein
MNPDVANARMDPWTHWINHGKNEGRVWFGGYEFSYAGQMYLKLYDDLTRAGVDPWNHYSAHGYKEGRYWPGQLKGKN